MIGIVQRSFQYLILFLIASHILFVGYSFFSQIIPVQAGEGLIAREQVLAASSFRFAESEGYPSPNTIFERVNAVRTQNGLKPLRANIKLTEIAQARAKDMSDKGYYAHKDQAGRYYYDYLKDGFADGSSYSCENLDLGFTLITDTYVNDWLGSDKGHRDCMLEDRVTDAGYAVAAIDKLSGGQTAYVVVAIHAQSQ